MTLIDSEIPRTIHKSITKFPEQYTNRLQNSQNNTQYLWCQISIKFNNCKITCKFVQIYNYKYSKVTNTTINHTLPNCQIRQAKIASKIETGLKNNIYSL